MRKLLCKYLYKDAYNAIENSQIFDENLKYSYWKLIGTHPELASFSRFIQTAPRDSKYKFQYYLNKYIETNL